MADLRDAIVDTALVLFNARGVPPVGMRELARALDLSPGNLTYHFARKEDLVAAVMQRLSDRNEATLEHRTPDTLAAFLETYRVVFRNQYEFRCLLLGLVHITDAYPDLRDRYMRTATQRRARLQAIFRRLRDRGALRADLTTADLTQLVGYCSLISRFWLSEHHLEAPEAPSETVIGRYLILLAGVFVPYATARGLADLRAVRGTAATAPTS